jgi:catechol 2,3-dioxygenase-like lactoylglutathione lyase family enzyme
MEATGFRLKKVGVIMIGVSDLARSVAFYRDTLGLPLQHQFEGFAFFDADGMTLALSLGVGRALGGKPGAMQVVFSVEDVRAAHEALSARGVTFSGEPFNAAGTMWSANFTDPDGHHLSLFGPERKMENN